MPSSTEIVFLRASKALRLRTIATVAAILLLLISSAGVATWLAFHQPVDPRVVTNLADDGIGSLRWAIANVKDGDTITFQVKGIIRLTSANLDMNKNLTIRGPGRDVLSIFGGVNSHRVYVEQKVKVTISDLTLSWFDMNGIANYGTLTLKRVSIAHNQSPGNGGGIENWNTGTLILDDSIVSENRAASDGTEFTDNPTYGNGGGIANHGKLTLINSIVSNNLANVHGGGIANRDLESTVTITNSIISSNIACEAGGGIFSTDRTFTITNSTIADNKVVSCPGHIVLGGSSGIAGDGGGIESYGRLQPVEDVAMFVLVNSTVSGNSARANGGGIENVGILKLTNTTISGNTAGRDAAYSGNATGSGNGGGINNISNRSIENAGQATITFCTIYGNSAHNGGGIFLDTNTQATMRNSLIAGNQANSGPDVSGTLVTAGYNLLQNTAGAAFNDPLNQHVTDKLGGTLTNLGIDPLLQTNGGVTKTHALSSNSPAIDQIPVEACLLDTIPTDQRGVKRPQRSKCDIGAYEYKL